MTSSVRAEIIISAKDQASQALKTVATQGQATANTLSKDLKTGASGAIQSLTGMNLASIGLAAGMVGLAGAIKYSIDQAAESERVNVQTAAAIKSTGGAAGLTADQIGSMAGKLSQLNAVDDETIQSAQNILLTFKSIKSDAFEPATQAALDLSVRMGMDLRSSIMMVGKALEDPVRGITALRRAGVSFSQEQREMIKKLVETGQSAKAQQMILAELNSEVGGSGVAAAQTYSGQLALLKVNTDNLAESLGMKLLPPLTKATAALNLLLTLDQQVKGALEEHEAEVLRTADSYEVYRAEVLRAREASGLYGGSIGVATKQVGILSEEIFNASREVTRYGTMADEAARAQGRISTRVEETTEVYHPFGESLGMIMERLNKTVEAGKDYEKELVGLKARYDDLTTIINGPVKAANDDYAQQQKDNGAVIVETMGKIDALNAKPQLTDAQRAELAELNTGLAEQRQAYEDTAKKHEETTARILFGFVEQRLAADGWQKGEIEFLASVGRAWGIYDEATSQALGSVDNALDTSKGNADEFLKVMSGVYSLPDKTITITTNFVDAHRSTEFGSENFGGAGAGAGAGGGRSGGGGDTGGNFNGRMAAGGNLIVPPGFPNDSYRLGLTSGERVTVTPAGQGNTADLIAELRVIVSNIPRAIRDGLQMA